MLKKSNLNPIIKPNDLKSDDIRLKYISSIFNPSAIKIKNEYNLLLRVQNRGRETVLVKAKSNDGLNFTIAKTPIKIQNISQLKNKIFHIYDPRITNINNVYYIVVAMDLDIGCRLGLIDTKDFNNFQFKGIISENDNRNGVLFPEKINGKYIRLDRPNLSENGGVKSGSQIHISYSEDLLKWTNSKPILQGNFHYWDELIGAGTPPIKTMDGWLVIYHGVATHFASSNIYQAGVFLLELNNPEKVIYRSRYNILEPDELYEQVGQVNNVVFPTGIIVEDYDEDGFAKNDSEVKIYYGGADTCICLATTTVKELILFAKNEI